MNNVYLRKANYYETDMMGIVHHSNHIRYFEEARLYFMSNVGCDVIELERQGVIIPNVDAYAKYEKPVRFCDEVSIEVRLVKFNGAIMRYDYVARLENGDVAATGHTTHCFVGRDFKPLSLKRKFPEFYNKLRENVWTEPAE